MESKLCIKIFAVPLTGIKIYSGHDVYISDNKTNINNENTIYIVVPDCKSEMYLKQDVETIYKRSINNKEVHIVVLKILPEYVNDFKLLIEGKYSKIEHKEVIKDYWNNMGQDNSVVVKWIDKVFNKDETLKLELYYKYCTRTPEGKPIQDKELLNSITEVLERPQNCTLR